MSPIGLPLREVESVKELILVVGDAMCCHSAIATECNILHRGISDNNILIVHSEGEPTCGLSIDFDCALDLSKERTGMRGEMTGTLPYMSIGNLSGSSVQRTSLDDCESMLYILCWYATIGIDEGTRIPGNNATRLPIADWRAGPISAIINSKRDHLGSSKIFVEKIVNNFNRNDRDGDMLKTLAIYLYKTLFENHCLSSDYYGTTTKSVPNLQGPELTAGNTKGRPLFSLRNAIPLDSPGNTAFVDPFAMRAEKCDFISEQLLAITDDSWQLMKEMEGHNGQQ